MPKAGYVTIFGKPNSGKSTLINSLLNYNLSIVNRRAQTTRNKILGILSSDDYQIIFMDTPGVLEPKYELQKFMLSEIKTSIEEADLLVQLADVSGINYEDMKKIDEDYGNLLKGKSRILVLNKIDLINKDALLPIIEKLNNEFTFKEIVPVSALKHENIDSLKKIILKYIPESEFFYDSDTLTDRPEKFFVSEIIREKILSLYSEEIPYAVMVDVNEFKERENNLVYINADIIVERETQKIIIIGKRGEGIKRLGERARKELQNFLNKRVYLELFVKVRKDWRHNRKFISDSMTNKSRS